ncbi:MAG: tetratricopeptide repeat protein, partial [Bacteroidota bacterium]
MYSFKVLLFLCCIVFSVTAQQTVILPDSISMMKEDTLKVKALRDYAFTISGTDHAGALEIVAIIKTVSTQLKYTAGQALALDLEANIKRAEGNYNEAIVLHQRALTLLDFRQHQRYYVSILVNLGTDYLYYENPTKAIQLYRQALQYVKHDDLRYVTIHNNMGSAYSAQGNYS